MLTKTDLISCLWALSIIASGCEKAENPNRSPAASPSQTIPEHSPSLPPETPMPPPVVPPETPPVITRAPACYLNSCFETTLLTQIRDPQRHYVYPDPRKFPNESLRSQYISPFAVLDLQPLNLRTQLSKNFILGDFMSPNKGRYALYSSDVVLKLQLIRNKVNKPVYITSGYRSPGYNRNIDGSAQWSRHTYGDAVDFYVEDMEISQLAELCKEQNATFTLNYSGHVHCDWRNSPLDPSFYQRSGLKPASFFEKSTMVKLIESQSRIHFHESSFGIVLSAQTPVHEEEEGDPTYEWSIVLPTGEERIAVSPTVELPKLRGTHKIKVLIGGSIALEEIFTW